MPDWRQHIESRLGQQPLDAARLMEVREELAQHLDDFYHSLLAEGVPPAEAEQKTLNELQQGALGTELRRVLPSAAPPVRPGENPPVCVTSSTRSCSICATVCDSFGWPQDLPSRRCSRWGWALEPIQRFSSCSMPCACAHFPSRIPRNLRP